MGTDIQILKSWLVGWCMYCVTLRLHDIKKRTSVPVEYTTEIMPSCWCLYFTFLVKVLPPPHYSLGSYLYLFFVIHFAKSKLIARSVPVLTLPEKNVLFPLLEFICYYIPIIHEIYLLLRNQVSAEIIGIKLSSLITPS